MASSFEQSTTKTPKKQKIRTVIRNAKEQDWTGINAIPDKGELVYASDVNTLKIGDGVTIYDNLPAISGGSGGTSDYTDLTNKPQINDVTLVGNVSIADLGFANVATSGNYNDLSNLPTLGTMAAESASDYTKTSSFSNVAFTGSYDDLVNKPSFGTAAYANTTDFATAAQGDLANTAVQPTDLSTVATTGNYNDLSNKPTIPAAQVNVDWNATSGIAEILNKPNLATVATTGSYDDLTNKPYIPEGVVVDQVYNAISTNAQAGVAVAEAIANKVDNSSLANVAFTGSYDDLTNQPTIPTNISQLNNDAGYVVNTSLSNVAFTGNYEDLTNTPTLGSMAYANTSDYTTTSNLANVALSGEYDDLLNKPTIPDPQIQSDWNQTNVSAVDYIKNKPYIPEGVVVDQTYDPFSTNAQSGTAVANAVSTKSDVILRDWSL